MTGNANKLQEVKAILSTGVPIDIDSRSLDSKFNIIHLLIVTINLEIQYLKSKDPLKKFPERNAEGLLNLCA